MNFDGEPGPVGSVLGVQCNLFKGDATLIDPGNARAWNYNAIPHQVVQGIGGKDRALKMNGVGYTAAPSQIMFEGLAKVKGSIYGTLAVASPGYKYGDKGESSDYDFVLSKQPDFDINVYCWNEVETKFSRHLEYKDFEPYDLTRDLQLDIASIFTLGFHCATTSTHPLWPVVCKSSDLRRRCKKAGENSPAFFVRAS